MDKKKIIKAGKIAHEVKEYAKTFIKKGMPLLEIAEELEAKIVELGGQCAFPANLSINEIAAHYTPSYDDEKLAHGLLKVDVGVHIDGWIADTAFSMDLENFAENKKLIEISKQCCEAALKVAKKGILTKEIGREVQRTAISNNANVIVNLTGHQIDQYDLHAGLTIPNIDDGRNDVINEGLYSIEPFITYGNGKVHDAGDSGIYALIDSKNVRSPIAREILTYIIDEYGNLPFASRWLVKEFGTKALVGLKQLEEAGNLHQYSILVEDSGRNVAQFEHNFLVEENETTVTTRGE